MPFFRLALLALPFMELASLILLGQHIGVGWTLLWVIGSGFLGLLIMQSHGGHAIHRLQQQMQRNQAPFATLRAGMWGVLAGLLLMIPGLITDALAVPCLLLALANRGRADQPGPGEPGGPTVWKRDGETIIEGEWEEEPDPDAAPKKRIDHE
ncbi:FxsA family protein [Halopseudomonas salegens]|uniref:UPF0716 protein FxsA n=1 Tax=Halopseudomonas salegens TaxID=1434072 RepID=A0A1H2EM60_9GAMM|nr:FxsA family protein [Halopseudomonas salegens]SDT96207.1 UPF0716 protein FxsA [Halopseudomonas salegens]